MARCCRPVSLFFAALPHDRYGFLDIIIEDLIAVRLQTVDQMLRGVRTDEYSLFRSHITPTSDSRLYPLQGKALGFLNSRIQGENIIPANQRGEKFTFLLTPG